MTLQYTIGRQRPPHVALIDRNFDTSAVTTRMKTKKNPHGTIVAGMRIRGKNIQNITKCKKTYIKKKGKNLRKI